MARITQVINDTITYVDNIDKWLDIGTGDGSLVKELKWEPFATEKNYMEKEGVPNSLGDSWKRIKKLKEPYDLVTMFDVIEHYNKKDGLVLLEGFNKRSKHVIVFTPEGFFPQDGTKENPYMEHLSGWEIYEFENLGYSTKLLSNFHFHPELGRYFNAILAWK
jgi:hypothetical protein